MQHERSSTTTHTRQPKPVVGVLMALALAVVASWTFAQTPPHGGLQAYTQAHAAIQDPPDRLGGPVNSGVMLDTHNGTVEQPFFHVMFQSFTVTVGHPDQP